MAIVPLRDLEQTARRLRTWLAPKLLGVTDLVVSDVVVPGAHPMSTETVTFRASWNRGGAAGGARYVAKVAPQGPGIFPRYDLVTEQWVMQALSVHAAAPVPATPWVETDDRVLGAPFLVMECLPGRVAGDDPPYTGQGWVLDLTPAQRELMYDNGLVALSQIHAADPGALGLDFLDRPELGATPLAQQMALWRSHYESTIEGEPNPTLDAAFEWVEANLPGDEPTVLNWGSARLGNLLFDDGLAVTGVLDWKLVGLGSPEMDLGWWLFVQRHHTEGMNLPRPAGIPDHAATVNRYTELTGHRVRYLEFYEIFAGLRLSILMHRMAALLIAAGALPPGSPMQFSNPASQLLARMVGAPAPTGVTQSLIRKRVIS